jgi:histidinol-phosphatase (PHP family)
MGSIHFLDDWHFTSREGRERYHSEDPDSVFTQYFIMVEKMIETGLFDILAHPDAIRRENFYPSYPLDESYERIASLLKIKGMSLEVNTGGLSRGAGSVYPQFEFIQKCVEAGVPLTVGSDAHSPQEVGRDFDMAEELIASITGGKIAVYSLRKRTEIPFIEIWGGGGRERGSARAGG